MRQPELPAGPVEAGLDGEPLAVALGHRLEDLPPQAADAREQRPGAGVEGVDQRAAVADADVHVGAAGEDRLDQPLEEVDGQVQDVAVHEQQDRGVGVGHADRHGPALALVLPQMDGAQAQGAGDPHRAVRRAVGDHEDLVDRRESP